MPTPLQTWQTFLERSLAERLDTETFTDYVRILVSKHPLSPSRICDLFLSPTADDDTSTDIRVVRWIQYLLAEKLVDVPAILRTLKRVSSFGAFTADTGSGNGEPPSSEKEKEKGNKREDKRWQDSFTTEETLFYRLAKHVSSGTRPHDAQEAVELVLASMQWMRLIISSIPHTHNPSSLLLPTRLQEIAAQNLALGTLVVAVVENAKVQRALSKGSVKRETRIELEKTLGEFIAVLVNNSPQSAARLEIFRTETLVALCPPEKEKDESQKEKDSGAGGGVEKEMDDILEGGLGLSPGLEAMAVEDLPSMNSRAGLYVYLNSMVSPHKDQIVGLIADEMQLVGRPLIDDDAILNYLHNRYQVCPG